MIILVFFFFTGFLGNFLSNNLKTNQLEVTDAQSSRAIARLKEPRDLFALPKDRDHDCPQQTARWPTECQVCICFFFKYKINMFKKKSKKHLSRR